MKILKGICSIALVVALCFSLSVVCFAGEAAVSGDATGDKILDARDVVRMKHYMALVDDAIDLGAVDFDGNGKVDTYELVDVRNMILESIKAEVIINVNALEENYIK